MVECTAPLLCEHQLPPLSRVTIYYVVVVGCVVVLVSCVLIDAKRAAEGRTVGRETGWRSVDTSVVDV